MYAEKPEFVAALEDFVRGRPPQPVDAFLHQSERSSPMTPRTNWGASSPPPRSPRPLGPRHLDPLRPRPDRRHQGCRAGGLRAPLPRRPARRRRRVQPGHARVPHPPEAVARPRGSGVAWPPTPTPAEKAEGSRSHGASRRQAQPIPKMTIEHVGTPTQRVAPQQHCHPPRATGETTPSTPSPTRERTPPAHERDHPFPNLPVSRIAGGVTVLGIRCPAVRGPGCRWGAPRSGCGWPTGPGSGWRGR